MSEEIHEECGVFGIWSEENAAKTIYYGLTALQHRGQESAGIVVSDTKGPIGNIHAHKGMGLVSEVFTEGNLQKLTGNIGIGHVRYSTQGESVEENAQPIFLTYEKGTLALSHNGNIVNAQKMRRSLEEQGLLFSGTTDSEVIACQIAQKRMKSSSIEEAAGEVAKDLIGGFALLVMSPRKLIGIRDPLGLKPLCIGMRGNDIILASESCALNAVGARLLRDVEAGEMVIIENGKISSQMLLPKRKRAHCIFEYIYFARLDSIIDGIGVYDARLAGGRALARRYFANADVVTGVPESGLTAAMGYAEESGIPFRLAFSKNSYVGRTFIKPTQEERASAVRMKLSVIEGVVKGKSVVLIDDSIVRGTTIKNLIGMLRNAGATAVHVRISSPPFLHPCYYGTDIPDPSELIADTYSVEEIRKRIGADSLAYMAIEDFEKMTGELPLCRACFNGVYPTNISEKNS